MKKIDLTGKRFGMLTVIEERPKNKWGSVVWLCECECGAKKEIPASRLKCVGKSGLAMQSCGCKRLKDTIDRNKSRTKHGMGNTGIYKIWKSMMHRCNSPKNKSYSTYGGRGIAVCDRWRMFENFFKDMGDKPEGMTLDRIDCDGNYEPSNCRWADKKTQANNTRTNRKFEVFGEVMSVAEISSKYEIPYPRLYNRLVTRGLNIEQALKSK